MKRKNNLVKIMHQEDFTVVGNKFVRNEKLSLKAKALLILILGMSEEFDFHANGLASFSTDGKASVQSGLRELEKERFLVRQQNFKDSGHFSHMTYYASEYEITEEDLKRVGMKPLTENQSTETPFTEKPLTEKPSTEKPLTENRSNKKYKQQEIQTKEIQTQELQEVGLIKKSPIEITEELRDIHVEVYPVNSTSDRFIVAQVEKEVEKLMKKKSFDSEDLIVGCRNYLMYQKNTGKKFKYLRHFHRIVKDKEWEEHIVMQTTKQTQIVGGVDWGNI